MCLVTRQKKPKIAKEDIEIFKILRESGGTLLSPYQGFVYILNQTYKTNITVSERRAFFSSEDMDIYEDDPKAIFYEQGFHAFLKKEDADEECCDWFGTVTMRCIIPKGSEYFTNKCGHVVSNQIIIKERT